MTSRHHYRISGSSLHYRISRRTHHDRISRRAEHRTVTLHYRVSRRVEHDRITRSCRHDRISRSISAHFYGHTCLTVAPLAFLFTVDCRRDDFLGEGSESDAFGACHRNRYRFPENRTCRFEFNDLAYDFLPFRSGISGRVVDPHRDSRVALKSAARDLDRSLSVGTFNSPALFS